MEHALFVMPEHARFVVPEHARFTVLVAVCAVFPARR
jgi:hypothetical protein